MPVFTVTKPVGTTDTEFQAYVDLLEEIGIDVSNASRTPEPGTEKRWLYVWPDRDRADRFRNELRRRTYDDTWYVHEFEPSIEESGPLAPLVIRSIPSLDGTTFDLESNSRSRIMRHYPNARFPPVRMSFPTATRSDFELQHGPVWEEVATTLTGLSQESLNVMGGYRIQDPAGNVLHEAIPEYGM